MVERKKDKAKKLEIDTANVDKAKKLDNDYVVVNANNGNNSEGLKW